MKSVIQSIDWWTVLLYLILVFMGWINIYAAAYNEEHSSIFDMSQKIRQTAALDWRILRPWYILADNGQ